MSAALACEVSTPAGVRSRSLAATGTPNPAAGAIESRFRARIAASGPSYRA